MGLSDHRIAVVSDIHGNVLALNAVLDHAAKRGVDFIINLGDCVTSPLWPRETFDRLRTLSIPTVRGNHDRLLASHTESSIVEFTRRSLDASAVNALASTPSQLSLDDGILAVHGRPGDDSAYLLEDLVDGRLALAPKASVADRLKGVSASLVLCGHSHVPHVARVNGTSILNPGSVGCPRYAGNPDPFIAEPSSPHARYAIAVRSGETWSFELHAIAYDWAAVRQRAVSMGFPEWATGFDQGDANEA